MLACPTGNLYNVNVRTKRSGVDAPAADAPSHIYFFKIQNIEKQQCTCYYINKAPLRMPDQYHVIFILHSPHANDRMVAFNETFRYRSRI